MKRLLLPLLGALFLAGCASAGNQKQANNLPTNFIGAPGNIFEANKNSYDKAPTCKNWVMGNIGDTQIFDYNRSNKKWVMDYVISLSNAALVTQKVVNIDVLNGVDQDVFFKWVQIFCMGDIEDSDLQDAGVSFMNRRVTELRIAARLKGTNATYQYSTQ